MPVKTSEIITWSPNVKPSPTNIHLMRSLIFEPSFDQRPSRQLMLEDIKPYIKYKPQLYKKDMYDRLDIFSSLAIHSKCLCLFRFEGKRRLKSGPELFVTSGSVLVGFMNTIFTVFPS